MCRIKKWSTVTRMFITCSFVVAPLMICNAGDQGNTSTFIQIGEMHKAIGSGDHRGRVDLKTILEKPHFYGVGAIEGLQGEITIQNSKATVTRVSEDGSPQTINSDVKATMLVGQSVNQWTDMNIPRKVSHEEFDQTIKNMAVKSGLDTNKPFVFVVEGQFTDVQLHIINGACPIHARMKKMKLARDKRPFELDEKNVTGTIVGIYAENSVGKLTHPATRTHAHLTYIDSITQKLVTGHLEQVGMAKGATLKLPVSDQ